MMNHGQKLRAVYQYAVQHEKTGNSKEFADQLGINEATLFRNYKNDSVRSKYIRQACIIAGISEDYFYSDIDDVNKFALKEGILDISKNSNVFMELERTRQELKEAQLKVKALQRENELQQKLIEAYDMMRAAEPPGNYAPKSAPKE